MTSVLRAAGMMTPLLLAACGGGEPPMVANDVSPPTVVAATSMPTPTATPAPNSGEAAAAVVSAYYALIAERRYADAARLREDDPTVSPDALAREVARYATYRATVGAPGRIDAGAGQRYVEVPVTIAATATDGGDVRLGGTAVLHRVADIDGATPEQRRWRIRSIDLAPAR